MEYNYNKFDLALMADMPFVRSKKEKKEYLDCLNTMYNELLGNDFMKQRNGWLRGEELEQFKKHPLYKSPVRLKSVKDKHEKIFGDKWSDVVVLMECRDKIEKLEVVKKPRKLYKRTKNAATHYGICQICGSQQKADVHTNRLASHGYIVEGYHRGECRGSHQLPLEKSCELVKDQLAGVQQQIEDLQNGPEIVVVVDVIYGKRKRKAEYIIASLEMDEKYLIEKIENWKETDQEKIQYLD
mgnify:CR=1 FL=1